jgi:hypothetical protein
LRIGEAADDLLPKRQINEEAMEIKQRGMWGTQERHETRTEHILHAWSPKLRPGLFKHREHAARHKGRREARGAVERVKGQRIGGIRGIKVDRIGDAVGRDKIEQCFHEIPMRIDHHEPTSSLHILVNQVGQQGRLASTRFAEHPHMSQAIRLGDADQGASAMIHILAQHTQSCMVL